MATAAVSAVDEGKIDRCCERPTRDLNISLPT